jgi:hypothetical protein
MESDRWICNETNYPHDPALTKRFVVKITIKDVRYILQGLPQTHIHSLTKSNKSCKIYFTTTSTNIYSQFNKILPNTSYHLYYILLNCAYTFVEVFVKYILLLLLDIVKLLIYVCGSPCQIHLTTCIRSC